MFAGPESRDIAELELHFSFLVGNANTGNGVNALFTCRRIFG
jgi:hypothetical protein